MYIAWTFTVLVSFHWSVFGADNLGLRGFTLKHPVWLHNYIHNHLSGLTPKEFLIKPRYHFNTFYNCVWDVILKFLILRFRIDRKFQSGIINYFYKNLDVMWYYFPLWKMSGTIPLVSSHHHFILFLMISLRLLLVFSTGNDTLIDNVCNEVFHSDHIQYSIKINYLLMICLCMTSFILMKFSVWIWMWNWLSWIEKIIKMMNTVNKSSGLKTHLMSLLPLFMT